MRDFYLPTVIVATLMLSLPLSGGSRVQQPASKKSSSGTAYTAAGKRTSHPAPRSSSRTTTKRSRTTAGRTRTSAPRGQLAPTPERYMEIQRALAEKGYYTGPVDGAWTPACVDALKRFQQDQSLDPDGKIGSLSLIALGLGPRREPLQLQALTPPQEP